MKKKVEIDLVKSILSRNDVEPEKVTDILKDIQQELMNDEDEDKPKAPKKQFVVVVSDPEGDIPKKDFTGWVMQILEDENPAEALPKLYQSAYDFNATKKGQRMPISTVGDACETVSPRITKPNEIWIKTKVPILVMMSDNKIPMDVQE